MNKKDKGMVFVLLISIVLLFSNSLLFAQTTETLTFVTYYPSPYGSYDQLYASALGVGDANGDGSINNSDVPSSGSPVSGDVWIAGKVGIGTTNPTAKLNVVFGGASTLSTTALYVSKNFLGGGDGVITAKIVGVDDPGEADTGLYIHKKGTSWGFGGPDNFVWQAVSNGNPIMTQTYNGNVGIGTTTPTLGRLQVVGSDTLPAFSAQLGSTANEILLQSESLPAAGAYAWKFMQDESVTGDLFIKRRFNSVDTEVIRFERISGNVGIGTTNPIAILDVRRDATSGQSNLIRVGSGISSPSYSNRVVNIGYEFPPTEDNGIISAYDYFNDIYKRMVVAGSQVEFWTGPNAPGAQQRMFIDVAGNVGIGLGAVSAAQKLDVNGNVYVRQRLGIGVQNPGYPLAVGANPDGVISAYVDGSLYVTGTVSASGWATLPSPSDVRLKMGVETLPANMIDKLLKLRGVSFEWRRDEFKERGMPEGKQIGMIAQEVETQFPELVNTGPDGFKGITYNQFIPVFLEAMKAQQKEIEELKSEVANLKK